MSSVSTGAQPPIPEEPPLGHCPSGTLRLGPFARGGSRPVLHVRRKRMREHGEGAPASMH